MHHRSSTNQKRAPSVNKQGQPLQSHVQRSSSNKKPVFRCPLMRASPPGIMTVGNDVALAFSEPITADREPFSEYLWMEHEEEFNRQVEEQLREEEFIERCIQELLEEEEEWEWFIPSRDLPSLQTHTDAELVINSSLNPFAKEFVPGIQKHTM